MPRLALSLARAAATVAFVLSAGSAYALISHTWVSNAGSGSTCTRDTPCASLSLAQDATAPGGVISVLDPVDFSFPTITKSLTIRAEGVDGGATSVGEGGPWIVVSAGASDVVTLEGLLLTNGGITFDSGAQLHVIRCVITTQNAAGNTGIRFQPNSASKLSVTDTVITNYGSGTGGGIVINPQAGGSAQVALEHVTVNGNAFGIAADGSNSTGGINMTIADSMVANNVQDGIIATTSAGHAPIGVLVTNTKSANNAIGIRSLGPNVTVRVKTPTLPATAPAWPSVPAARFCRSATTRCGRTARTARSRDRWRCNERGALRAQILKPIRPIGAMSAFGT